MEEATRNKIVEITNVTKLYGSSSSPVLAITNFSLDIYSGEFISLVGPSGCGKSTILKIMAGLFPRSSGQIYLRGLPVDEPSWSIGLVLQTPALLRWRTVLDNIMLPVEIGRLNKMHCLSKAKEMIEFVGLQGFADRYPHELSGGMQQRVAICRALITDPEILLMDEPFAALDELTRQRMNFELNRIWRQTGKTIFFVTHNIAEAVLLSTRVAIMSARPGTIISVLDIDLQEERAIEMTETPEFIRYIKSIRTMISAQANYNGLSVG